MPQLSDRCDCLAVRKKGLLLGDKIGESNTAGFFSFSNFFFLSFPQDVNFTEICSVQVISPAFSSSNVNAGDGLSFSQITVGGDKVEEIVQFLPPHAPFDLTV